jgi:hypothetical protein
LILGFPLGLLMNRAQQRVEGERKNAWGFGDLRNQLFPHFPTSPFPTVNFAHPRVDILIIVTNIDN